MPSPCLISAGVISSLLLPKVPHSVLWLNLGKEESSHSNLISVFLFNTGLTSFFIEWPGWFPYLHTVPLSSMLLWGVSERRDEKKLPHGWQHGDDSKSRNSRSHSMDPNSFSGISFFGLSDFLFCFRYISQTPMLSHAFVPLHMLFPLYGMIPFFFLSSVRPSLTPGSEGSHLRAYLQTQHCVSMCRSHYSLKDPALFCWIYKASACWGWFLFGRNKNNVVFHICVVLGHFFHLLTCPQLLSCL